MLIGLNLSSVKKNIRNECLGKNVCYQIIQRYIDDSNLRHNKIFNEDEGYFRFNVLCCFVKNAIKH